VTPRRFSLGADTGAGTPLGTPNACADCHKDRPATWAAETVAAALAAGPLPSGVAVHTCERPVPDLLEALTGEQSMDASALVQYFDPLTKWLMKENQGRQFGW